MSTSGAATIAEYFAALKDPRIERTKQHQLMDILVIAICAVICGADSWVEVEAFGEAKQKWLKGFLQLPNGIPSHDTFGRVFALLDSQQFQECFVKWIQGISTLTSGQVVAVDGKTLRRSYDRFLGKRAIHMVSAWATANHLVLGQVKVDEKSNEITAIPELLRVLELNGCIVTIDALGCQKEIAETIVARGGDYLLAVKENQGHLYHDIQDLFAGCQEGHFREVPHGYHRTVDKGHGRIEIRRCWTINDPLYLAYLRTYADWKDLRSVVMVTAERHIGSERTTETRYYISSLNPSAQLALQVARGHWAIENQLHWVLDVAFHEDLCRVRKDHAPHNFAILRHIALNLLKQESSAKLGIKAKRLKAGWDEHYLLKILSI